MFWQTDVQVIFFILCWKFEKPKPRGYSIMIKQLVKLLSQQGISKTVLTSALICSVSLTSPLAFAEDKTLHDVVKTFEAMPNTSIYRIETENHDDHYMYEIATLRNGQFYESFVDKNGLLIEQDRDCHFFFKPLNRIEEQVILSTEISFSKAIEIVSSKNNSVIEEADFRIDDEGSHFDFIFSNDINYSVDATSGTVRAM